MPDRPADERRPVDAHRPAADGQAKAKAKVNADPCPCRSRRPFDECCGPVLAGAATPPTAEALMRSRFTAYARGDVDHVLRTWHPRTRPADLVLDDDLAWVALQIVSATDGGPVGTVHFRASYRSPTGRGVLEETSRFERVDGEWRYVDGDVR